MNVSMTEIDLEEKQKRIDRLMDCIKEEIVLLNGLR